MRKAAMLGLIAAAGLSLGAAVGTVSTSDSSNAGTIIIEVRPLQSAVRLDGVPVGTAHDLIARPLYVRPGSHILSVTSPGFIPSTIQVDVRPAWGTRIWVDLVPDRRG